jgi:ubiquinone/menaquinone biosynthesis C-methylase UbiE
MSEALQPLRVLEIGCGGLRSRLAKYSGGLLFQSPATEYIGIDPAVAALGPAYSWKDAKVLAADCTDMPFEDRTIDVAMMRNFFGQCTDYNMLDRFHDVAQKGLREAYRVLKPGGEVVVAEECTPWDAHDIEDQLTGSGFQVSAFESMSEDHWDQVSPDSPWLRLRGKYYADTPMQRSKWAEQGSSPPYVMTGIKPSSQATA